MFRTVDDLICRYCISVLAFSSFRVTASLTGHVHLPETLSCQNYCTRNVLQTHPSWCGGDPIEGLQGEKACVPKRQQRSVKCWYELFPLKLSSLETMFPIQLRIADFDASARTNHVAPIAVVAILICLCVYLCYEHLFQDAAGQSVLMLTTKDPNAQQILRDMLTSRVYVVPCDYTAKQATTILLHVETQRSPGNCDQEVEIPLWILRLMMRCMIFVWSCEQILRDNFRSWSGKSSNLASHLVGSHWK